MTLDELKMKYETVISTAKAKGVSLKHVHLNDAGKLYIQGAAPNEDVKNDVWNAVKAVDPNWVSDVSLDISIDSSLPQPVRTYTVVAGDSLWKIASKFYASGAEYPKIIAGNPGKLKDDKSVIHPGDVLVIP